MPSVDAKVGSYFCPKSSNVKHKTLDIMKKLLLTVALASMLGTSKAAILTDVSIAKDETKNYNYEKIGSDDGVKGSLTNNGEVNANQIWICDGYLVNNGTMNDVPDEVDDTCYDFITLAETATGGYIENNGVINGRVFIQADTTLSLNNGSYTDAIEIYENGILNVNGSVQTKFLYLDDAAEVVMTLGSSIDLMGGEFEFYDVNLVLLLDSVIEAGDTSTDFSYLNKKDLFVNFVNKSWESDGFTGDTMITLRDGQGNETTRKYSELSVVVPEPATTTLSLLALVGLAMHRRRK